MRPENLIVPFKWEEKKVIVHDRVWFVPNNFDRYEDFSFPGWNHADFFGNDNPVCVEYCSGNGAWIANKAIANPHLNWVAIERKFDRVRKIWSKTKNHSLSNLLVIFGEGHNVTSRYFPAETVSDIFINFADPWPKKRHAKNRIIQTEFVNELIRILKPNGSTTFVTDDAPFSEWSIEKMLANTNFQSVYPSPYYVNEHNEYGTSYFDQLWRDKGREILYHKFLKTRS
jgi:tRNA (guanine-N7-)-methyltransferase